MTIILISFKPQKVCITLITPSSERFSSDFLQVVYPVGVPENQTLNICKMLITLLFSSHNLYKNIFGPYSVLTVFQI